jgi:hypothetical protein
MRTVLFGAIIALTISCFVPETFAQNSTAQGTSFPWAALVVFFNCWSILFDIVWFCILLHGDGGGAKYQFC